MLLESTRRFLKISKAAVEPAHAADRPGAPRSGGRRREPQFEVGGTRYEDPNPDDRDPSVPDPRQSRSTNWASSKAVGVGTPTTSGTTGTTTSRSRVWFLYLEISSFRSAWAAHARARRKTVEASVAMTSWSLRSGDRSRRLLGSTASG